MLVWLDVILTLASRAPVDPPALSTPDDCTRGQSMRSRGIRVDGYEVMGLRSCGRGSQAMSLAIHGDYRWWVYGHEPVTARADPQEVKPELRLVRHALARGTLADGAPAVLQVLDVLWIDRCLACDPPINDRKLTQTIMVCSLPDAARVRCTTASTKCSATRCPNVSLVRGVLRAGTERITVD